MAVDVVPRLMLVEDDPDTASLITEVLNDHFGQPCVEHHSTVAQALAADIDQIDLVLTDHHLPDGTGLEVLTKLHMRRAELPVVMVTGENVPEIAKEAIRLGAYDYIVKSGDFLFVIPLIVEKSLAIWRTKQDNVHLQQQLTRTLEEVRIKNHQLEDAVRKLETMAATDPLTGLSNRRSFNQSLERYFAEANRYGHDLACIMIDLDGFKQVNDTYGHQRGDELLQQTARVLEANCRRSDVAARYGGDEFVILLPNTDEATTRQVAERVRTEYLSAVKAMFAHVADPQQATDDAGISMGITSLFRSRPPTPEAVIAQADHALYHAKSVGRNLIEICDEPPADHTRAGAAPDSNTADAARDWAI